MYTSICMCACMHECDYTSSDVIRRPVPMDASNSEIVGNEVFHDQTQQKRQDSLIAVRFFTQLETKEEANLWKNYKE